MKKNLKRWLKFVLIKVLCFFVGHKDVVRKRKDILETDEGGATSLYGTKDCLRCGRIKVFEIRELRKKSKRKSSTNQKT